eukprot:79609_1
MSEARSVSSEESPEKNERVVTSPEKETKSMKKAQAEFANSIAPRPTSPNQPAAESKSDSEATDDPPPTPEKTSSSAISFPIWEAETAATASLGFLGRLIRMTCVRTIRGVGHMMLVPHLLEHRSSCYNLARETSVSEKKFQKYAVEAFGADANQKAYWAAPGRTEYVEAELGVTITGGRPYVIFVQPTQESLTLVSGSGPHYEQVLEVIADSRLFVDPAMYLADFASFLVDVVKMSIRCNEIKLEETRQKKANRKKKTPASGKKRSSKFRTPSSVKKPKMLLETPTSIQKVFRVPTNVRLAIEVLREANVTIGTIKKLMDSE